MSTNVSGRSPDTPVAFTLLAAGRGVRFGDRKLHLDLGGKPLWRWAVDSALEAGLTSIHVVTNDSAIAETCARHGWSSHPNPDAASGMASSLRTAIAAIPNGTRRIVALADMPFVEPGHWHRLADTDRTAFTRYPDGRLGVPAGFSDAASRRLLTLEGDRGATSLDWPDALAIEPPSVDTLLDIDTPDIVARAQAIAIRRFRATSR